MRGCVGRFRTSFLAAQAKIFATGFGITDEDRNNGIYSLVHKRERIFFGFDRLGTYWGKKANVELLGEMDQSIDITFAGQVNDEDSEENGSDAEASNGNTEEEDDIIYDVRQDGENAGVAVAEAEIYDNLAANEYIDGIGNYNFIPHQEVTTGNTLLFSEADVTTVASSSSNRRNQSATASSTTSSRRAPPSINTGRPKDKGTIKLS
ncbi:hypothetical protein BGZ46_005006 [Entomortierella lignicola]|nr:hypothetical protein BGZ46_005006 [Entomortierella lignicola]